ncbi:MAG: flagellar motor switch protein FliN [Anaerolineae bacterium]|nr:flagellar motor switch protein FliN [Anaerolineae bacterium]
MVVDDEGIHGHELDLGSPEAVGEEVDWSPAKGASDRPPGRSAAAGESSSQGEPDAGYAARELTGTRRQRPAGTLPSADARTLVQRARFVPLAEEPEESAGPSNIDLLLDVNLRISVELGRATLTVRETLNLAPGNVVELDKLAGDPVDILVNGRLIARGEVVVVDDQFGVRITDIASARQRMEAMR